MSDLGRRLRRELDEVAPPADLEQIMLHVPVFPLWRVGRALAYAAVVVAVVGVTLVLLSRDGSDEVAADSSLTVSTVETTDSTIPEGTTSTTTTPTTVAAVPLVPPDAWPFPALDPVFALPECEVSDVGDFIYGEFSDLGGLPTTNLSSAEIADVMPLPRLGVDSVFTEDPASWCFSAGRIEDVVAWKLQGPESLQYIYAAARSRESNSVPEGVIDDYYHQSRIASGQGFNVSVRPEGRAVGVVDHDYFVMAGAGLQPEGDIYLWGERLAMSLYKAPFDEESRDGPFSGGLFDPTGLPEGYGPCITTWLVWEQSGEGAEWSRTAFCDGRGGYIETLFGFGGDYPPIPAGDTEEWGDPPFTGVTWVDTGRRNIAFDVDGKPNLGVWLTGPEVLPQETLSAVARSMLLFRPELTDPRKGEASFSDAGDPDAALRSLIAEAVSLAPDGLAIDTNQWPDDGSGGDMLGIALALGANRIDRLDNVDVVVADMGDRVQAIFSCGGLWFNVHIGPESQPRKLDPGWSRTDGRYETIIEWLQVFEDSLGCTTAGSPAPTTAVTSTTMSSAVGSVVEPERVSCSVEVAGFPCEALIDGTLGWGWQAPDGGIDATIRFEFDTAYEITEIGFTNLTDAESFRRNARIEDMEIALDELSQAYRVRLDDDNTQTQWVSVRSLGTTAVTITITSAFPAVRVGDLPPFGELALGEITFHAKAIPGS